MPAASGLVRTKLSLAEAEGLTAVAGVVPPVVLAPLGELLRRAPIDAASGRRNFRLFTVISLSTVIDSFLAGYGSQFNVVDCDSLMIFAACYGPVKGARRRPSVCCSFSTLEFSGEELNRNRIVSLRQRRTLFVVYERKTRG